MQLTDVRAFEKETQMNTKPKIKAIMKSKPEPTLEGAKPEPTTGEGGKPEPKINKAIIKPKPKPMTGEGAKPEPKPEPEPKPKPEPKPEPESEPEPEPISKPVNKIKAKPKIITRNPVEPTLVPPSKDDPAPLAFKLKPKIGNLLVKLAPKPVLIDQDEDQEDQEDEDQDEAERRKRYVHRWINGEYWLVSSTRSVYDPVSLKRVGTIYDEGVIWDSI